MSEPYDSTADTEAHIARVRELLEAVLNNLDVRAGRHDASKLKDPEKAAFDLLTPRLKNLTYGSDEYRACLREMNPALEHHYAENSHHPEHWTDGIGGMSLLDLVEMLLDWVAAAERHEDGDIVESLSLNEARFGYPPLLSRIFANTLVELGIARREEMPPRLAGHDVADGALADAESASKARD